jgi:hypothetical protein
MVCLDFRARRRRAAFNPKILFIPKEIYESLSPAKKNQNSCCNLNQDAVTHAIQTGFYEPGSTTSAAFAFVGMEIVCLSAQAAMGSPRRPGFGVSEVRAMGSVL